MGSCLGLLKRRTSLILHYGIWKFGIPRRDRVQTATDLLHNGHRYAYLIIYRRSNHWHAPRVHSGRVFYSTMPPLWFLHTFHVIACFYYNNDDYAAGPCTLGFLPSIPPILDIACHVCSSGSPCPYNLLLLVRTNKCKQSHGNRRGLPITIEGLVATGNRVDDCVFVYICLSPLKTTQLMRSVGRWDTILTWPTRQSSVIINFATAEMSPTSSVTTKIAARQMACHQSSPKLP